MVFARCAVTEQAETSMDKVHLLKGSVKWFWHLPQRFFQKA